MLPTLQAYAPLSLAGLFFYGGASRLTNGATSTSAFYAYQNARKPNDGSAGARLLPVLDILFGTAILRPGRSRLIATAVVAVSFVGVAAQRAMAGLPCRADVLQAAWAGVVAALVWL